MAAGPFAVDAEAGERLVFGEITVVVRASAETTSGAFSIIEEAPRGAGAGQATRPDLAAGFEGFFRELADAHGAGRLGPKAYAAASERYGITWLD
jgi:hypothetical protein